MTDQAFCNTPGLTVTLWAANYKQLKKPNCNRVSANTVSN